MEVLMNIYNDFKGQMGHANVTNQYIEMLSRIWEREYCYKEVDELSRSVGIMLSKIPESIVERITKQYLIGIHSCIEVFLLNFKSLPGSPTYNKDYPSDKDESRLVWTVQNVFEKRTKEITELMNICEYYRLVRNSAVHSKSREDNKLKVAKSKIHLSVDSLETKIYGKLTAPNDLGAITFDDQVLFSRAANLLVEKIYKESEYDWDVALEEKRNEIDIRTKSIYQKAKKKKKILKFMSECYYINDDELLKEAIDRLYLN